MLNKNIDYKSLFEQIPVARFLVEYIDSNFYIVEANNASIELFEKSKEEIIGSRLKDVISANNHSYMYESLKASYELKLPVTVPTLPDLLEKLRPAGFWINPILNENKEVILLDVIGQPSSTDISVIERERDDALSLLTSIFDASEIGILVFDKNRQIIKMNQSFERIYGWSKLETIGKDFLYFVTEDEHDLARNSYENFLQSDENHVGEVKIFCKNGTIANTLFTTASLKLSRGRRFQVTTLFDITNRKQMELSLRLAKEQADAANNAKSAFLANMSHELRTPLNAIIGFSEMMVNESFGPLPNAKYKEYLSDVHMSASHLLQIINEVLDMSKIEAGKIELDEQEVNLNSLLKAMIRIMNSKTFSDKIKISEIYQENLPKLYADPRLIRQIFINLITNSIKYSINGGVITIKTELNHKDEIEITVMDEGVGIPANRIKDAMEPFGQIHDPKTHSEVYQGTGLGLPLAKAMVEMHGGIFTLTSIEGKGTTVVVSFSKSRTRHH